MHVWAKSIPTTRSGISTLCPPFDIAFVFPFILATWDKFQRKVIIAQDMETVVKQ